MFILLVDLYLLLILLVFVVKVLDFVGYFKVVNVKLNIYWEIFVRDMLNGVCL